jgi:hypothetical protein
VFDAVAAGDGRGSADAAQDTVEGIAEGGELTFVECGHQGADLRVCEFVDVHSGFLYSVV